MPTANKDLPEGHRIFGNRSNAVKILEAVDLRKTRDFSLVTAFPPIFF
jgi:hypothetical protein